METILNLIGIKKAAAIAGFVGGVVSLRFFDGLKFWERIYTVLGGTSAANYLTAPIMLTFKLDAPSYEGGVGFFVGLFGMSIVAAALNALREAKISDFFGLIRR